jgi:hypothetical protein
MDLTQEKASKSELQLLIDHQINYIFKIKRQ